MHKLFGILLHRFLSSSYLLIFSVIFISLQTHGYLFYNFGLLSIQLYYFCSHCSSFGHQEFFQLILMFLLRPLICVCGRECVCRVSGSGGGFIHFDHFPFWYFRKLPGSSWIFPTPVPESAIFLRSYGFFSWRMVLEIRR